MLVHTLDLRFKGQEGLIAAFLVECGGELALIETGPASALPVLLRAIRATGFEPAGIKHVFVTHIHLDHAGAAGWWAQQGSTVYAHLNAVKHLIDPSKLMDSAARVYGDQLDSLWGRMVPAPADKVVTLNDGDVVKVGDVAITALDTPGHARHHHAYAIGDICFTGDVAGMKLQGCDYISVTAAPPQFDPVAYDTSLERLRGLGFAKLFLTHFGEVTQVTEHLTHYAARVKQVHECVRSLMAQGLRGDALREAYGRIEQEIAKKSGLSESDWQRYEGANTTSMGADGIALFVEKQQES
jgi:glyoxylase-like metal-dependent hydrolase (beta-lactamase superfamily II)